MHSPNFLFLMLLTVSLNAHTQTEETDHTPLCCRVCLVSYLSIFTSFPDKQHSTVFYLSSTINWLIMRLIIMLFTEGLQIAFVGDNGTAIVECMEGAGLAFITSTKY